MRDIRKKRSRLTTENAKIAERITADMLPPALCSLYCCISKSSRLATILAPPIQFLQEHAESAEESIGRKSLISARSASSCEILDRGFGCGSAALCSLWFKAESGSTSSPEGQTRRGSPITSSQGGF